MLNALIRFSLNFRSLILVVAILLLVYGGYSMKQLPVDVFPDLNRPSITIFTEAEGLAPEEVESLVTLPIETAVNGANGVQRVRSASGIGLSIIWVEFNWNTDIYIARQIVAERLQQVSERLPANIRPTIGPISSIMGEIMLVGVSSENSKVTPMELRSLVDWNIRQRLLAIAGVSQITVIGGEQKQYQILVDPQKLQNYNTSLHDVEQAAKNSNVNSTGGFLLKEYQEGLVRNLARVTGVEDLAKSVIPVQRDEASITLDQVAEIRFGGAVAKRGDASVDGKPAVILSIQKQPGADTIKLTRLLEKELGVIAKTLPEGVVVHRDIFQQSLFIERAITNVKSALKDGALLVGIILFVFFLSARTTFITVIAIPLSFMLTAIIFKMLGMSINTMTLGGLAVAVGELVDDAIVGVENVVRRLQENRQSDNPRSALEVIYEASSEVRNSIVLATIMVVLVFIPLFAMQGIEGRIFAPLGIAYIVSILASLIVSLTVTPVLCYCLLPTMKKLAEKRDGWLIGFIKNSEKKILLWAFPRTNFVLVILGGMFLIAVSAVPFMGKEFLPPFNEGSATVNIVSAPGTSLKESNRIGVIAEKLIHEVPEVIKTARRTGRAELDDHAEGVHSSEIEVAFKEMKRNRKQVLGDIRQQLEQIPGIVVNIGQPVSHRIDHMLSGVRAQIAIKIFGNDLGVLLEKAENVRQIMSNIHGVVDLSIEKQVLIPQLHIRINRDKAVQYGVMAGEVAEYAELAMNGKTVSQIIEGQKIYDVVMRLADSAHDDMESIAQIPIDTLSGGVIPLGLLANIEEAKGPNIINHENMQRRIVIQANVAGADLVGVVNTIKSNINDQLHLPKEYFITYEGQFESQESASQLMIWLSVIAFISMFMVLYSYFKSINLAVQIMLSIPLAFIGAVAGVMLTGGVFSIATMVAFITLTGIAARNGIMMVAHYLHLMQHEGEEFGLSMIVRGTQERIVPVLMTMSTASLALVPLVLAADQPGHEILHPVAVVIFSGLFSSTLLDLVVRPLIFYKFAGKAVARPEKQWQE